MLRRKEMDMHSKKQYLQALQKEYLNSCKEKRGQLLSEAEKRTGLVRNYLIQRLSVKTRWEKIPGKRSPRPSEYGADLIAPLVQVWDIFDEPCGQRLEPLLKDEVEKLRRLGELFVSDQQAKQLKKMSSKTIDRLLEHEKATRLIAAKYEKQKTPLLYSKIPTKMSDEWNMNLLGQIQIDGVEHCGQSVAGEYLNTVSTTDIRSQWWEGEVVMGKGQHGTLEALKNIRKRFPFTWREIHPDNGTSFINYFLYGYAQKEKLEFSRSRPFKKNDNCFVEQKNSRNVRRHVGHVRYDTQKEQAILNDLYHNELRLFKNFFQPIMRLELKERYKGHIHREYQPAKTPYRYLIDDPNVSKEIKDKLNKIYENLNPAGLHRSIEVQLKMLAKVYQTKYQRATEICEEKNDATVRFSFDPTAALRLGSLTT